MIELQNLRSSKVFYVWVLQTLHPSPLPKVVLYSHELSYTTETIQDGGSAIEFDDFSANMATHVRVTDLFSHAAIRVYSSLLSLIFQKINI